MTEKWTEWTGEPRLPEVLWHHYGIRLKDAHPSGGVLRLETDQGVFALKRVQESDALRWHLVKELGDYISETGLIQFPVPVLTERDGIMVSGHQRRYVLLPWIKGKVYDLRTENRWPQVVRTLARFHSASKGFSPSRGMVGRWVHTGKWKNIWENLNRQIQMFKLTADLNHEPEPVDRLWLKQSAFAEGMVETAIQYLEKLGGDQVVLSTRKGGEACHCNLHRRNLVWDETGEVHFIDWNRLVLDVRSRDLARLVLYAYGRTGSLEPVENILKNYRKFAPLEEEEYSLIYAQLLFPHRLLRTLSRIYREQKVPSHLTKNDLSNSLAQEAKKEGLLREYPKLVEREFGVTMNRVDWLS
ncbi:phosphotransferase [Melghirimyces algeriensis]|uniref:Spore coat protein, CotS family n=1 Tax=Melghirimyces algeriensis TaxID=910412 RepID=A0A521EH15_9BACL|nr:phosphotransferase [Melghirimyces algeriensis]SMO83204.1 spore coat protein, CotS family [Melghirimyces algeriensis]